MTLFFLILFGLYSAGMVLMLAGWNSTARLLKPSAVPDFISVVVPFRNEQKHLADLIADFSSLDYPRERFEVILVDDHSTDHSAELAAHKINLMANAKLYSLADGVEGKKQALSLAIGKSNGNIIVTTDADCRIPRSWLTAIERMFRNEETRMVIGAVRLAERPELFAQLQSLEFASLIGVSRTTSNLGFPTMCNGANLSFLKTAFFEVGGYEGNFSIPSGDDEFLLRKIAARYPHSVIYMTARDSVVTTEPSKYVRDFFHQRLRWAGKWRRNTSMTARFLAVFVFCFQFSFLMLLVFTVTGRLEVSLLATLAGVKLFLEGLFLIRVCRFLQIRFRFLLFLWLQLIYPVYVFGVGIGSFFLRYRWKSR